MSSVVIHQTVHGYDRGHRLLASSTKLSTHDADLLARLSDLSGALAPGIAVPPYLSMFPIGKYYAVSQTWLDEEAPRSGCVLTHTLLIDCHAWGTHSHVRSLGGLLRKPNRHEGFDTFSNSLDNQLSASVTYSERDLSAEPVTDFVLKFFGDGQYPVVWPDCSAPDRLAWALCDFAWSTLRERLSICTFCLQPRTIGDRSFQLMFVPGAARPRFISLPKKSFVEARPRSSRGEEPWVSKSVAYLLEPSNPHPLESALALVGESCEPDPTLARSLFLLQDLWSRVDQSSTAGVAVLDIIEALGGRTNALASLQTRVIKSTIESLHSWPISEALQTLVLLNERLARTETDDSNTNSFKPIRAIVAELATRAPAEALSTIANRQAFAHGVFSSPYVQGLLDGLEILSSEWQSGSSVFTELAKYSDFARSAIVSRPPIAQGFLAAMRYSGQNSSDQLAEWIAAAATTEQRSMLQGRLLREIVGDADRALASELLKEIAPDQVDFALTELAIGSHGFSDLALRDLVVDRLSNAFPQQVREWARNASQWSFGIADLAAATYELDDDGLNQLIEGWPASFPRSSTVVAAYVGRALSSRRSNWFREHSRHDCRFLATLLSGDAPILPEVADVTQRVCNECSDMPVATNADMLPILNRIEAAGAFSVVFDVSTASVVREFVKGTIEDQSLLQWQAAPWFPHRLRQFSAWQVENLLSRAIHITDEWHRAWRWVRLAPSSFYEAPGTISGALRTLMFNRSSYFTNLTADDWRTAIARAQREAAPDGFLRVCAESVDFGFNHTWLPISPVMAEAFYPVYEAVSKSADIPDELGKLFGMFTWDKAKELRSKLVESFYHSNAWRPGDLALAARNEVLLRKIYKRLERKWNGERFIRAMIDDLNSRASNETAWAMSALSSIVNNPNFEEPWD